MSSLKRKFADNGCDDYAKKMKDMSATFNHKLERTRDEVRCTEERILVLEKMMCKKEHLVPLAQRLLHLETYLSDVLKKLELVQNALQCCVTQGECSTYIEQIEGKLRENVQEMRDVVEAPYQQLNAKANVFIEKFDLQLSDALKKIDTLGQQAFTRSGTANTMKLHDFDEDLSVQFYMDGLEQVNGASSRNLNLSNRREIYKLFREWVADGNEADVRRTKKKGKSCYGLLPDAVPRLFERVAEHQRSS